MLDDVTKDIFASFGISQRDVEKSVADTMRVYDLEARQGGVGVVDGDGTLYARGSREGRMGEARAPGTRRVSGVNVHKQRFGIDGFR